MKRILFVCIFIGVIGVTLGFFSKKDVAIQEKAILSDNNNVIAFYRETEEGSGAEANAHRIFVNSILQRNRRRFWEI